MRLGVPFMVVELPRDFNTRREQVNPEYKDALVGGLMVYFKPEEVDAIMGRPAPVFNGLTALEYADKHGVEAVLDKYRELLSWEVTE